MTEAASIDPLERIEALKGGIPSAKTRRSLGGALDAALQALVEAAQGISRLEKLSEFTPLVSEYLDPLDGQELRRSLRSVQEVGQRLVQASDSEKLVAVAQFVTQRLTAAIAQTDQLVKRGWKAKVDQAFASTGRLGGVLRQIPETLTLGREMETLSQRAGQLAQSVMDATESTARYLALIADHDRINQKLALLGAGEAVVDFLLAVAEQSATLSHVTEDVRAWLDDRHALGRFKVGL